MSLPFRTWFRLLYRERRPAVQKVRRSAIRAAFTAGGVNRITFNTGDLYLTRHRVTGEQRLCSIAISAAIQTCAGLAAQQFCQPRRRHRTHATPASPDTYFAPDIEAFILYSMPIAPPTAEK